MAAAIREALADGDAAACSPSCPASARSSARPSGWPAASPTTVDIVPLYGMLDGRAQDAAIRPAPAGRRKVVLATSIAETSITIDGVRVVIDSGLSRLPRYEPATGLTRLETVRVSRASADQRAGRAGRTQPGVAIRLWRAEQTAALPAFTPPEILEADLSGAGARLRRLRRRRSGERCAFLDPPPAPALAEARALLDGARRPRRGRAADAGGRGDARARRCRCGWRTWWPQAAETGQRAGGACSPCC